MMKDINKLKKAKREYQKAAREAIKCENRITDLLQRDRTDLDAAVKAQKSEQTQHTKDAEQAQTMQADAEQTQTMQADAEQMQTMQQQGSNENVVSNGKSDGAVDGTHNVDVHTHADEIAGCTCAGVQNSNGVGAYCVGPDETAKKWCYVIGKSGCKDEMTSFLPGIARSIKTSHDACAVLEKEGLTDKQDIKATNEADTEIENGNKLGKEIHAKQEEDASSSSS